MPHRTLTLYGWAFFIASSLFFLTASIQAGDLILIAGSICFLVGNIIFLVPILREKADAPSEEQP